MKYMSTLILHESCFIFFVFVQDRFEIAGHIKILNIPNGHICIDSLARKSAGGLILCDIISVTIKARGKTHGIILKNIDS